MIASCDGERLSECDTRVGTPQMRARLQPVQPSEPERWRYMARRRRGQFPEPRKERGLWKIRYRTDQAQPDGTIRRVQRTKCLGPLEGMTLTQARKAAREFLQPINDVAPGIEHADKTMNQLILSWRVSVMHPKGARQILSLCPGIVRGFHTARPA